MQRIFVVTHPEATHHVEGLVGGWYDSHLTEKGKATARRVAEALKTEVGEADVRIYASDLLRTVQTAEAVAEQFGQTVRPMRALRELSYGLAEGRPKAWLDERFVPAPPDNRLDHVSCDGAETKRVFAARISAAMTEILSDGIETKIVVTHGYALTFVVAAWIRMPIEASGYINVRATPGGITFLQEDDFLSNRELRYVNRTAHLV